MPTTAAANSGSWQVKFRNNREFKHETVILIRAGIFPCVDTYPNGASGKASLSGSLLFIFGVYRVLDQL